VVLFNGLLMPPFLDANHLLIHDLLEQLTPDVAAPRRHRSPTSSHRDGLHGAGALADLRGRLPRRHWHDGGVVDCNKALPPIQVVCPSSAFHKPGFSFIPVIPLNCNSFN
jgi:hypothetical protein